MDPIMAFNNLLRPTVGADWSRPPPLYRPSPDAFHEPLRQRRWLS